MTNLTFNLFIIKLFTKQHLERNNPLFDINIFGDFIIFAQLIEILKREQEKILSDRRSKSKKAMQISQEILVELEAFLNLSLNQKYNFFCINIFGGFY